MIVGHLKSTINLELRADAIFFSVFIEQPSYPSFSRRDITEGVVWIFFASCSCDNPDVYRNQREEHFKFIKLSFSTNHETTFRKSVIVETKGNWFIVNFRQIFSLSFYLNVSQSSLSFNEFASMSYMESPLL